MAAAPLGSAVAPAAWLVAALPAAEARAAAVRAHLRNLLVGGLAAALALAAAWFAADWLVARRVYTLVRTARALSTGRLGQRTEVRGRDEIGLLGRVFNEMADHLTQLIAREQEAKAGLEERVRTLVERRTRELADLNELSDLLQAARTLEEAFAVIGRAGDRLFPGSAGALFLVGEPNAPLEAAASWGGPPPGVFLPDACWALRRGRPHYAERPDAGARCDHVPAAPPVRTLCVPLAALGETLGVLHLASVDGLAEDQRRLAATAAESVALALANLRARERLRQQSVRDGLTGLFNRRYLEEALDREVRRATTARSTLGVLMIDVDHFKQFNDRFSHAAGDVVLKEIGRLLRESADGTGVACRYGGEELVLVLPDAKAEDSRDAAERIREEAKRLALRHDGRDVQP
ncbi:MAG: diguanylate cyclase, partial [bacterium]